TWSGTSAASVELYRDGVLILTTTNDGFETDVIGARGSATYTYRVCEAGTTSCSSEAVVTF
ncbi:MAG: hypothetical protein R3304_11840, partial [Longimicrobiales bacterium]|nr:hypothetical protein [Longimicrobiales bacterium]